MRASTLATLLEVITVPETTCPGETTGELNDTFNIFGGASGGKAGTVALGFGVSDAVGAGIGVGVGAGVEVGVGNGDGARLAAGVGRLGGSWRI